MQAEWKYCFRVSDASADFLSQLIEDRAAGNFLGSTFPAGWTHTCFAREQCRELDARLNVTGAPEFQTRLYYRGNLFDRDFGLATFSQPLVQWCPSPTYSLTFGQEIPPQEPWGITMEGEVLLAIGLREVIRTSTTGLQLAVMNVEGSFDAYRILMRGGDVKHGTLDEHTPLVVDCARYPETDILSLSVGVILCSARLAGVLRKYWTGIAHNKFQPVRCLNFPKQLAKRSRARISVPKSPDAAAKVMHDIRSIEAALHVVFPSDYVDWIVAREGLLPHGWLSPLGGGTSEMMTCTNQEHNDADPRMPENLVPIYAYGNGDYICADAIGGEFVQWEHASGKSRPVAPDDGFRRAFRET